MVIAVVTGVVLLFWYVPSVEQAYGSLEGIRGQWWGGQLMRSLHRYSSDACVLFLLLHAIRYFAGRRFAGPRWLAWVTGIVVVGLLWAVGWTGYWLVWDERGHAIALGTARGLDVLPVFTDPISRTFLTNGGVNTFLFFVVFFIHMLLPLLVALGLWLHITRLSRPVWMPSRTMTAWVIGSMVALSLLLPVTSADPADMLDLPDRYTMDWWYLAPLAVTDRLGGGAIWAVVLLSGSVLFSLPWWMPKGKPLSARVEASKCLDCNTCFADCPYGAIEMVPRQDGKRYDRQARVDPKKCVGCGVCAGSCDSSGVGLPWLDVPDVRRNMDRFLAEATARDEPPLVAFLCASGAGAGLRLDPETHACAELPGYQVWPVPCAAWVHPLTVERALRRGARGVLVAACGGSGCAFREGALWTQLRMDSKRTPELRDTKVDLSRLRVVHASRGARRALLDEASRFAAGEPAPSRRPPGRGARIGAALAIAVATAATAGVVSDLPYASGATGAPELVVSFRHPGATGERCRDLTPEEIARQPVHMRQERVCERGRAAVRLRVAIDGEVALEEAYPPGGLFGDEASHAVARVPLPPGGPREITIAVGETSEPTEWTYSDTRTVEADRRHVVLFDRGSGFAWHAAPRPGIPRDL